MKAKKRLLMAAVAALALGAGVTTFASQKEMSALGTLEYATKVEMGETSVYGVIEEDGSKRDMTQAEIEAMEAEMSEGAISADGQTFMSPGTESEMPLVLENDGSVREMTAQEWAALQADPDFSEFSAQAGSEVVEGSFSN